MKDIGVSPPSSPDDPPLTVVTFCAQWCGTCRSFEDELRKLLDAHSHTRLLWLDIEDDAELVDDIDVENFPTVAIFRSGTPLYFGTTLPQQHVVSQLLRAAAATTAPLAEIPPEVAALYPRLPA